ncbi:MAG: response regulator [Candidatus Delongbacteria bacterium]|jgi:DNA-binding NtrC family response regulator|nr:response regulator [Candidatus Delongbacteria bacterium]MDD4205566.1 response regulator [Candidatus Delongbacteria bacterium]MDY0016824.1 response regulator [Candidatus Delongbacteria bacterium]
MGKKKALVIDDGIDFIAAYKAILEANGIDVISATNGKDGFQKVENEKPDVIVLDVMMETPDSGFEFLQNMQEKGIKIPVILCSSIARASQMNFDLNSLGAKVIMQKPVDLDKLVENVKKYAQ